MEFVVSLWGKLTSPYRSDRKMLDSVGRTGNDLISLEYFLVCLQKIVLWEDVAQSLTTLIGVQAIFWLYYVYRPAPYFLASSLLLVHVLYEWYSGTVLPEIQVPPEVPPDSECWTPVGNRVLSAPEISRYLAKTRVLLQEGLHHMKHLRLHSPFKYLSVCFSGCMCMYWLGSLMSGFSLLYLLITSALTLPGVALHCVPQSIYDSLRLHWSRLHSHLTTGQGYFGVSEFVPDSNVQNSALLEVAAGIVNGREPSPDLLELSAFMSGLSPPPSLDYHSLTSEHSDDELSLTPSSGSQPNSQQVGDSAVDGESPQSSALTGVFYTAAGSLADYVRERLYGGDVRLLQQPQQSPRPPHSDDSHHLPESAESAQAVNDSDFEML